MEAVGRGVGWKVGLVMEEGVGGENGELWGASVGCKGGVGVVGGGGKENEASMSGKGGWRMEGGEQGGVQGGS